MPKPSKAFRLQKSKNEFEIMSILRNKSDIKKSRREFYARLMLNVLKKVFGITFETIADECFIERKTLYRWRNQQSLITHSNFERLREFYCKQSKRKVK